MDGLYESSGPADRRRRETREFSEVGKGMAYQTFNEGDEYTIVLFNRSNQEVGVDLKIDGLNSIYFNNAQAAGRLALPELDHCSAFSDRSSRLGDEQQPRFAV